MATLAQTTANRANAQLSTGPRSAAGKAASARNSTRLGLYSHALIIPGEDPAEWDALATEYEALYQPVGPLESALVMCVAEMQWMKLRYARIEAEVLRGLAAQHKDSPDPLGAGVSHDSTHGDTLTKIFRRRQAAHREWLGAINLLEKYQARRIAQEAAAPANPPETRELTPDWVRSAAAPAPQPRPLTPTRESDANLALRL